MPTCERCGNDFRFTPLEQGYDPRPPYHCKPCRAEMDEMDEMAQTGKMGRPRIEQGQIRKMVDRFLSWSLPKDFNPDGGITFAPLRHDPTGTNLFNAQQAEEMIRHLIGQTHQTTQFPPEYLTRSEPGKQVVVREDETPPGVYRSSDGRIIVKALRDVGTHPPVENTVKHVRGSNETRRMLETMGEMGWTLVAVADHDAGAVVKDLYFSRPMQRVATDRPVTF